MIRLVIDARACPNFVGSIYQLIATASAFHGNPNLSSRMMLLMQCLEPCLRNMRINLRGGEVGMAEEHLDHS